MTSVISIDKNKTDQEIYESLFPQIDSLLLSDEPILTGLANFTAALNDAFTKISWVGFYFLKNDFLFLGPFQGKTACAKIKNGSGVCGTSAMQQKTIIVDDVDKFPGHIACDSRSKSEIVVPIIQNEKVIAVLDLDSYDYSAFNQIDKVYLKKIIDLLKTKFNFSKLNFF
jgi:L-methionine (R)-S-oxide reductase